MKINITFSDLIHVEHSAKVVPYGVALVASYALKHLADKINIDIFKNPNGLIRYLEKTIPKIACFSNYIWNKNLSYEFARQIKIKQRDTIIVFGGPNYPLDSEEQKEFLLAHPDIDFYIEKEGEIAFVELFLKLIEHDFDVLKIKNQQLKLNNCHYLSGGHIIRGNLLPRIENLNDIPSPYMSGLCDKFLEEGLTPLIQNTRGCPFTCTYCQEGNIYFSKIRRFSNERTRDEVEYIAKRAKATTLQLADSNFGMYKEDIRLCHDIAMIQKKYDWPKVFSGIAGKNQKEFVIEAASLIKGSFLAAAVQSMDPQILKNIKRNNVSVSQMINIAKEGEALGINSFSEVILCLPGDTKDAHFKSISELIDAGISVVRSHQFIMLPGSEAATKTSRSLYKMETRFRVNPNTVDQYELFGNVFFVPEIDEICVGNNSMSFNDYLECRLFNLTVEIFYNNDIFQELITFLKFNKVIISSFIKNIHIWIMSNYTPLSKAYEGFIRETNEIWDSHEAIMNFLGQPRVIDRYVSKELGNNEQLLYQSIAVFNYMDDLHEVAFAVADKILAEKNVLNEKNNFYLKELKDFSKLKKNNLLSNDASLSKLFHFDFPSLEQKKFYVNPFFYYLPKGINIKFEQSEVQKKLINDLFNVNGLSNYGQGNILTNSSHIRNFYRETKVINNE